MNTYTKYCPNVFVAKCTEPHEKGEIIPVTTNTGEGAKSSSKPHQKPFKISGMKPFSKLTDRQKSKVQERINEAYKRTIETVTFLEYLENRDKKQTIFQDSIDICYKAVSNLTQRGDFECQLLAMFQLSGKTNFIQ